MRVRVIFCGIVFISLLGCELQKRSIDITPHLRWSLIDSENSKITSDDGGLLLRGGCLLSSVSLGC